MPCALDDPRAGPRFRLRCLPFNPFTVGRRSLISVVANGLDTLLQGDH